MQLIALPSRQQDGSSKVSRVYPFRILRIAELFYPDRCLATLHWVSWARWTLDK